MEPLTFFLLLLLLCASIAAAYYYSKSLQLEARLIDAETEKVSNKHEFLRLFNVQRSDLEKWQNKTLQKFGFSPIHRDEKKDQDTPFDDSALTPLAAAQRDWQMEEEGLKPGEKEKLKERLRSLN